jgi:hypothetical protein
VTKKVKDGYGASSADWYMQIVFTPELNSMCDKKKIPGII